MMYLWDMTFDDCYLIHATFFKTVSNLRTSQVLFPNVHNVVVCSPAAKASLLWLAYSLADQKIDPFL